MHTYKYTSTCFITYEYTLYYATGTLASINVDSAYVPLFAIIQALWATLFVSLWRKRESSILHDWNENELLSASSTWSIMINANNSKTGTERRLRHVISYTITYLFNFLALYFIYLTFLWEEDIKRQEAMSFQGINIPFAGVLPLLVRILFPAIVDPASSRLFKFCTDLECHRSKNDSEDNLTIKKFIFGAVAKYSTLFYVAFIKQDLDELRTNLIATLTIGAIIGFVVQLIVALHTQISHFIYPKKDLAKIKGKDGKEITLSDNQLLLRQEDELNELNIDDDFMELASQFGFISMFSVAFPAAPLFALASNMAVGGVDILKLYASKRFSLQFNRARIGIWQEIFEVIGFLSVVTNTFILCFVTTNLKACVPLDIQIPSFGGRVLDHDAILSFTGRVIIMVALEHALVFFKFVIRYILVSNHDVIHAGTALGREVHGADAKLRASLPVGINVPSTQEIKKETDSPSYPAVTSSPSLENAMSNNSDQQSSIHAAKSHVLEFTPPKMGRHVTPFFADPMLFIFAFVAAPLLHMLNFSLWYYLPCVIIVAHIFSISKGKDVHRKAIALSVDEEVVQELLKSGKLPSWVDKSCFERVQWLNSILAKLWPFLSAGICDTIMNVVNPILEGVCEKVSILNYLQISALSFGETPPSITSIYFDRTYESLVRIDVDITWASELFAIIRCKLISGSIFSPMINVEVKDITFQGVMRFELKDFTKSIACFNLLSISFIKPPQLKVTLKLQSYDIANLGFGRQFNLANFIEGIIISEIDSILVYPKCIDIRLGGGDKEATAGSASPIGILVVTITKANDLKAVDFMGKSDPYVKIKIGSLPGEQSTSVIGNNLNPVWHESFEFLVFQTQNDFLEMHVFDQNYSRAHESLGICRLSMEEICDLRSEEKTHNLHLYPYADGIKEEDCKQDFKGALSISTKFVGLSKSDVSKVDEVLTDSQLDSNLYRQSQVDIKDQFPLDIIEVLRSQTKLGKQLAKAGEIASVFTHDSSNLESMNDTKLGVISISEIKCMNMNPTYSGDRHVFARCQLEFSADYKDRHPEKRNKRTVTAPGGSEARFEEMFHFIAHHVYFKPTGKKDGKFASKEVSVPTMRYQADREGANQYLNTIGESTMSILISVYDDHKQMKLTSYSDYTLLGTFRIKLEDVVMHGEEFISRRFLNEELEGYNIADNTNGNTLESRKISLKFEWRLAKKSM